MQNAYFAKRKARKERLQEIFRWRELGMIGDAEYHRLVVSTLS